MMNSMQPGKLVCFMNRHKRWNGIIWKYFSSSRAKVGCMKQGTLAIIIASVKVNDEVHDRTEALLLTSDGIVGWINELCIESAPDDLRCLQ